MNMLRMLQAKASCTTRAFGKILMKLTFMIDDAVLEDDAADYDRERSRDVPTDPSTAMAEAASAWLTGFWIASVGV